MSSTVSTRSVTYSTVAAPLSIKGQGEKAEWRALSLCANLR